MLTALMLEDQSAALPSRPSRSPILGLAVIVAASTLVIATAVVFAVFSASRSAAAAAKTIGVKDFKFTVPNLTVAPGDSVTWANFDMASHTVTSKGPGPLRSPNLREGQTFSFTFPSAGIFAYFCEIHPDMKGTITVAAAAPSAAVPAPAPAAPRVAPAPMPPAPMPPAPMPPAPMPPAAPAPASGPGGMQMAPAPPTPSAPGVPAPPAAAPAPAITPPSCAANPVGTLIKHLQGAHLQTSPGQQVSDLLDLNKYTLTHTLLVDNMLFGSC